MAHPMIDFDVERARASQEILKTSKERPNPRIKPVVAIARGKGGGKTRSMEEVRRNLMRRKTTLPIAITFNSKSAIARDPWLEHQIRDAYSFERVYALSVSARMLFAVFGIPFSKTADLIYENLYRLDWKSVDAPTMIQETLKFVLQRVNEARALLSIDLVDTVVLLMDENAKADRKFGKEDLGAIVRQALLDDSINGTNITLVISDLGFLPENLRTDSDRRVKVLVLPARLSPGEVLSKWWFPHGELDKFSPEQSSLYQIVVALLNNMPRALQITAEFLHSKNNNLEECTEPTFFVQMFDHIFLLASELYEPLDPPEDVLVAAFFCEKIRLEEKLLGAVRKSVVTNPLIKFVEDSSIVPDVLLVLLRVLSRQDSSSPSVKLIGESIQKVLDTIFPSNRVGDVLEAAVLQALRARLALARSIKDMTLARLCGLSIAFGNESTVENQKQLLVNNLGSATAEALFSPIATNVLLYSGQVDELKASSRKDTMKFLEELDSFRVPTKVSRRKRCQQKMRRVLLLLDESFSIARARWSSWDLSRRSTESLTLCESLIRRPSIPSSRQQQISNALLK